MLASLYLLQDGFLRRISDQLTLSLSMVVRLVALLLDLFKPCPSTFFVISDEPKSHSVILSDLIACLLHHYIACLLHFGIMPMLDSLEPLILLAGHLVIRGQCPCHLLQLDVCRG